MKTILIFISTISLLFVACSRENADNPNESIIVGGLYAPFTGLVQSKTNSIINISDSIYQFNRIEASYYSHKPTSNQNVLVMTFIDTLSRKGKHVEIDIFTQVVKPEDFFQKSSIAINSIMVASTSVRENFFNTFAILTWDTAYFETFPLMGLDVLNLLTPLKASLNLQYFILSKELFLNLNKTHYNSFHNQLLCMPVRISKVSFPTNKVGLSQFITVVVS